MVVFINAQGTAQFVVPTPIYQNSNAGGQITLVAPFPRTTTAQVYFTLPSGAVTQKYPMTSALSTGETNAAVPDGWSVWSLITPTGVITAQKGEASATFVLQYTVTEAIAGQTPTYETLTTSAVKFEIYGAGQINLPDTAPTSNQWSQVIAAFARDSGRITALESLLPVISDVSYANGTFTFTLTKNASGEQPLPITISLSDILTSVEAATATANSAYTTATEAGEAAQAAGEAAQAAGEAAQAAARGANEAENMALEAAQTATRAEATANSIAGTANEAKTLATAANTNAAQAVSDVAQLRQDLNEAQFFRGYFATTALLTATEATENDYAYNAQDGKVWVYHEPNGWEATTQDVPDKVVPKATTSPQMDGTAAIGSSVEYAAADHVHPTDTSRASKAEVGDLSDLSTTDKSSIVAAINEAAASGGITELTDTNIYIHLLEAGIYKINGTGAQYIWHGGPLYMTNTSYRLSLYTGQLPAFLAVVSYPSYNRKSWFLYYAAQNSTAVGSFACGDVPTNNATPNQWNGYRKTFHISDILTSYYDNQDVVSSSFNSGVAKTTLLLRPKSSLSGTSDTNNYYTTPNAVRNALPALVAGNGIIIGSTTDSTSGKTTWTISADTSVNIDQALTDGKNLNGGSITFSSVSGTFGSTYYGYVGVDLGDYGAAIIGINYDGSGEITGGTVYDYSAYGGGTSQVGAIPQTIEVRDGSGDVGTNSYVKALYVMGSNNASMFNPTSFSGTFDSTWTSTTDVSSYGITLKVIV